MAEKAAEPTTNGYARYFVLEAIPGSLRLITPRRVAQRIPAIVGTVFGIWVFPGGAAIAALTGHYPFGFLPARLLGPDDFAALIASVQVISAIGAMVAFKKPWRTWYTRFLMRHVEKVMDMKVLGLRTGKLKTRPFDYCALHVGTDGGEFPLVILETLDRVEAAMRLAGQSQRSPATRQFEVEKF